MKFHNESKALNCDVCLKLFSYKSNLEAHYRTHTGEKAFSRQICDRRFSHQASLVQHQLTHRGDTPFKCSICPEGKYFETKLSLNQHMVFHYEPKFSCNYCNHKCYTKGNLKSIKEEFTVNFELVMKKKLFLQVLT